MKKIMVQFNIPGMTIKQYDEAWEELRKMGLSKPKGLVHHTGALHGNNWLVVDVWESMDDWEKFASTLGPLLGKMGIADTPPLIVPVHFDLVP